MLSYTICSLVLSAFISSVCAQTAAFTTTVDITLPASASASINITITNSTMVSNGTYAAAATTLATTVIAVPSYANGTITASNGTVDPNIVTAAGTPTPAAQSTITNMVVVTPATTAVVGASATPELATGAAAGQTARIPGAMAWATVAVALLGLSSLLMP